MSIVVSNPPSNALPQRQQRRRQPRKQPSAQPKPKAKSTYSVSPNQVTKDMLAALQKTRQLVTTARGAARNKQKSTASVSMNYVQAVELITMPINKVLLGGFRWGSKFNEQPTAAANVFASPNIGFSKGASLKANSPFAATDGFGVVRRIAEAASILFDQNPTGLAWSYQWKFKSGSFNDPWAYNSSGDIDLDNATFFDLPLTVGLATTTYKPHGNTLFAASHRSQPDLRFTWMNKNDTFAANLTNNSLGTVTYAYEVIRAMPDSEPTVSQAVTSGNILTTAVYAFSFSAALDGYYAFRFKCSAAQSTTFDTVTLGGSQAVFGHRCMPDLDTNISKVDANRVLGVSLMATNNSALNSMQGKVVGCQIPRDTSWYTYVGNFDALSQAAGRKQLPAMNGIYGYLKPSQEADFKFRAYHSTDGTNVTDSCWPIVQPSDFLVVYLQVTNTDGQDFYWTTAFGFEYKTNDQFAALAVSSTSELACNRALEQIKIMEQWFENPLHVGKILSQLKSEINGAGKFIIQNAPKAVRAAQKYGPLAMQLGSILAAV